MILIDNISKTYGKGDNEIIALDNINIQVEAGELFGLIGADGAGKSTLFKILATLIDTNKGEATIDNFDVKKDRLDIRKIIGYMPGEFSLYKNLTIQENLEFYSSIYGVKLKDNYDIFKDIYSQIERFKDRRAGKLSGGMKQKLALCCALIHKPKVLLLDEPTTGVDPVSRKEFWTILKGLRSFGITLMVSTPYMDEATLCDNVALIQSGKIMTIDSPSNIIKDYINTHRIYALKGVDNYTLMKEMEKDPNVQLCYTFGEYLHAIFYDDSNINMRGAEIKIITPNIEDCFIQLMNKYESN